MPFAIAVFRAIVFAHTLALHIESIAGVADRQRDAARNVELQAPSMRGGARIVGGPRVIVAPGVLPLSEGAPGGVPCLRVAAGDDVAVVVVASRLALAASGRAVFARAASLPD